MKGASVFCVSEDYHFTPKIIMFSLQIYNIFYVCSKCMQFSISVNLLVNYCNTSILFALSVKFNFNFFLKTSVFAKVNKLTESFTFCPFLIFGKTPLLVLMALFLTMNAADYQLQLMDTPHYTKAGLFPVSQFITSIFDGMSVNSVMLIERTAWWMHTA